MSVTEVKLPAEEENLEEMARTANLEEISIDGDDGDDDEDAIIEGRIF